MAAEASSRRRALLVVGVAALLGLGATGLVVAFRDEASTSQGRDAAEGQRLRVTLAVQLEDEALAAATATLRLTNTSGRPAWYRGTDCLGPGEPVIGPADVRPPQGGILEEGSVRDRLVAAGEAALQVGLVLSDGALCEAGEDIVRIDPDETVTWAYRTGDSPVDRSSALAAVAVVGEATRSGRSVGRIRLEVPFPELSGASGLTPDRAVAAFMADPTVADFVMSTGDDGVLTVVTRERDVWRMSIGASGGNLSGEVHADLTVTDVHVVSGPELSAPG